MRGFENLTPHEKRLEIMKKCVANLIDGYLVRTDSRATYELMESYDQQDPLDVGALVPKPGEPMTWYSLKSEIIRRGHIVTSWDLFMAEAYRCGTDEELDDRWFDLCASAALGPQKKER